MKTYKPYLILELILTVFLTLFFVRHQIQIINIEKPIELSSNWTYGEEIINLPIKLDVPKNTKLSIEQTLNNDFYDHTIILLRTSLQDVYIYLDDEVIYQKTYGNSIAEPYASSWHFIEIPSHSEGKTLTVELLSPYNMTSGQINEIFYGTEAMHYGYIISTYGIRLFIGLIVLLVGLIVMFSNFFIRNMKDKGYAYAGLFAVILSFWMIAESKMLQFITGSELLLGTLAYMAIPLFAVPMIIYLKDYVLTQYQKPLVWMNYAYVLHFLVITILHFTGIAAYFETVIYSQILLAIGIVVSIVSLILDYKKTKNNSVFKMIKIVIVLMFFATLEFINFLVGRLEYTAIFVSVGILLIMVYLLINNIKYLVERLKISYLTEVYEKLAYMDHITQGKNRLAFERDLDAIYKDEFLKKQLRLIVFDLDGLKKVNDDYGHVAGDEAIKKAYDIINITFSDQGECYRVGGDEFACLYIDPSDEIYQEKTLMVEKLTKDFDDLKSYHFGLSFGSSFIENNEITAKELYNQADKIMYEYKNRHKKENHLNNNKL